MNRKIFNISSKRQIIVRPVKTVAGTEFAKQILTDLIKEGLSGEKLPAEFEKCQAQIRPAVEAMLAKAKDIAAGRAEYATYDDVFGTKN